MKPICLPPRSSQPGVPRPTLELGRDRDTLFREGIECAAAAAGLTVETWCYRVILQYVDLAEPARPRVR